MTYREEKARDSARPAEGPSLLRLTRRLLVGLLLTLPLLYAHAARLESPGFVSRPGGESRGGINSDSPTFSNSGSVDDVGARTPETSAQILSRSGIHASLPMPFKITDLAVANIGLSTVDLEWTAPVADAEHSTGTVTRYMIRYSNTGIIGNEVDWTTATVFGNSFTPLTPHEDETRTIDGLSADTTYYFAVAPVNGWGVRVLFFSTAQAFIPIQYCVDVDTQSLAIDVGSIGTDTEVLITTSAVVANCGNTTATFRIRATTITLNSPWEPAATQAQDRFILRGAFHPTKPTLAQFDSNDNILLDDFQASGAAKFTIDGTETGVSVPVGESRILWLKLLTPNYTSVVGVQEIIASVEAAAP